MKKREDLHVYKELHHLVDQLTPVGAREVYHHVLSLVPGEAGPKPDTDRTPLFAGVIDDAPPDLAENIEKYAADRFNDSL